MIQVLAGTVMAVCDGRINVRVASGAVVPVETGATKDLPLARGHRIEAAGGMDAGGVFRVSKLWRVRWFGRHEPIALSPKA